MLASAIKEIRNTNAVSALYMAGAASWLSHQQPHSLSWSLATFERHVFDCLDGNQAVVLATLEDQPLAFVTWNHPGADSANRDGTSIRISVALVVAHAEKLVSRYVAHNLFAPESGLFWIDRKGQERHMIAARGNPFSFVGNWP